MRGCVFRAVSVCLVIACRKADEPSPAPIVASTLRSTEVCIGAVYRVPPSLTSAEGWPAQALANVLPFRTPLGEVPLPWWILAVVLGRELFMTFFRQMAARRGVVIAAIGPAKWKTGFQLVWTGAAFCWFWTATVAANRAWDGTAWNAFANFNGIVGVTTMTGSVSLTLYSLVLYLRSYGRVFTGTPVRGRG